MIDAPDLIAEVTQLETAFSLYLHLVRAPLRETLHHIITGGKMIYWPGVDWVTYTWCSRDVVDESGSHLDNFPSDPGKKAITTPLMQVGIKLPNYLLHCRMVISYHLHPPLGI
jgi:hypothetical protein